MKILVTGATGLLGNNIVRYLLSEGHQPHALVRASSDPRPLKDLDVKSIEGGLNDPSAIDHAIKQVDAVIHSAALVHIGWRRLEESRKVNVNGTRMIAEAAMRAGVRMVHVSTVDTLGVNANGHEIDEDSAVGEKVPCSYVVSKTEAEEVVRELVDGGLNASIVHPGFMLGPWDWKPSSGRMLLEVAKNWTPAAPTGGGCVADVRDVARGVVLALEKGASGRNYILGGENISYMDLWTMFAEISSTGKPTMPLGPAMRFIGSTAATLWTKLTGKEGDVNSAAIQMGTQLHYYSSQRARDELAYNWRPIRESAEDAWQWFVENGYVMGKLGEQSKE